MTGERRSEGPDGGREGVPPWPEGPIGRRYEAIERVGVGGMGEVHRARDVLLGREVAVKTILPHLATDAGLEERFRREARALARLRHPGIVVIHDLVRLDGGRLALILEMVPGHPLEHEVGEGPIPWDRCARIGAQVCGALAAAHASGVVHSDITPGNVLIEPGGIVRVADFGIARVLSDSTPGAPPGVAGTPVFMSPEQALGERASAASDLYSLGAVLFRAATGEPPFPTDEGGLAAALSHVRMPVPDPATRNPALRDPACAAIMRALAKRPEERFADAGEMADALRRSLSSAAAAGPLPAPRARPATPARTRIVSMPDVGAGRRVAPPPRRDSGGRGRRRMALLGVSLVLFAAGAASGAVMLRVASEPPAGGVAQDVLPDAGAASADAAGGVTPAPGMRAEEPETEPVDDSGAADAPAPAAAPQPAAAPPPAPAPGAPPRGGPPRGGPPGARGPA